MFIDSFLGLEIEAINDSEANDFYNSISSLIVEFDNNDFPKYHLAHIFYIDDDRYSTVSLASFKRLETFEMIDVRNGDCNVFMKIELAWVNNYDDMTLDRKEFLLTKDDYVKLEDLFGFLSHEMFRNWASAVN